MKANFIFAIATLMLTQTVLAVPVPGVDDLIPEVELMEPLELPEMEVHKVEVPEGQEQVEVHHGRFRVKLNFKDSASHKTRTRNRGGRS